MERPVRTLLLVVGIVFAVLLVIEFCAIPLLLNFAIERGTPFRVSDQNMPMFIIGWILVLLPIIVTLVVSEVLIRMYEWIKKPKK